MKAVGKGSHPRNFLLCLGLWIGMLGMGWAQLPPNMAFKWWINRRVALELGLTQDQVARIESLWRQHRKSLVDLRATHQKEQIDLEALLAEKPINQSAIESKVDSLYRAKAEVEKVTLLMRLKIRDVLTPEQQERSQRIFDRFRMEQRRRRFERDGNQRPGQRRPRDRRPVRNPTRPPLPL